MWMHGRFGRRGFVVGFPPFDLGFHGPFFSGGFRMRTARYRQALESYKKALEEELTAVQEELDSLPKEAAKA